MLEKEKQLLTQDADDVKKNTETIQEMKLSTALRGGIAQGKKREIRRIYTCGVGAVVATAAAVILTFSFIGSSGTNENPVTKATENPVQTVTTKIWSDSELFRSSSVSDQQSFVSALDRNLIKPVYQSVEKNGFQVEVMGAVTDGRKVFVLHSVHNNTDQMVIPADLSLDYGAFKAPSKGASLDITSHSNQIQPGQTVYLVYSANLLPSVSYPKNVKFNITLTETSDEALLSSSNKYRTSLEVAFELDPDMFKDQERALYPDRTMTVDGQNINVHQVLYTPLSTYVDLEYDKNNDKQIFKLINPVLIGKSGDNTEKLYYPIIISSKNSEVYSDASHFTLVFKNSQYDQLDSVSLKAMGIAALAKDQMKIVVDINKKQIIEAPDTNLKIIQTDRQVGMGEVEFQRRLEKAHSAYSIEMRLDDSFTDANGTKHKMLGGLSQSGHGKSTRDDTVVDDYSYNFGEEALDYPQPLTIEIKEYWNPIMETQAMELFSEN